uniref:Potassium channel domain-containing protein n=1 Tax=Aureoumbra lagunensis TaxID=44058 RepID=A0A7S3K6C3_9STRA
MAVMVGASGFQDFLNQVIRRQEAEREAKERTLFYYARKVITVMSYYLLGCVFYCYGPEKMSILRAIYFQCVSWTTVGFGDVVPSSRSGKVFTMIWILLGLIVILPIISEAAHTLIDKGERYFTSSSQQKQIFKKVLFSIFLMIIPLLIGAIYILSLETYKSSSNFDFVDAFYYSFCVITTVGYGDLEPTQVKETHIFIIFFVPFAVIFAAAAVHNIGNAYQEIHRQKKEKYLLSRFDIQTLREMDPDGRGINRPTYILAMLISMEAVDLEKLILYSSVFDQHDKDGSGLLDEEDLLMIEEEHKRKVKEKHNSSSHFQEKKDDLESSTPTKQTQRCPCFSYERFLPKIKKKTDFSSFRHEDSFRAIMDTSRPNPTTGSTMYVQPNNFSEQDSIDQSLSPINSNTSSPIIQYIAKKEKARDSLLNLPSAIFSERAHVEQNQIKKLSSPTTTTINNTSSPYHHHQNERASCTAIQCLGNEHEFQQPPQDFFVQNNFDLDLHSDAPSSENYDDHVLEEEVIAASGAGRRPRVLSIHILQEDDEDVVEVKEDMSSY